jgi:hypothetical protein
MTMLSFDKTKGRKMRVLVLDPRTGKSTSITIYGASSRGEVIEPIRQKVLSDSMAIDQSSHLPPS